MTAKLIIRNLCYQFAADAMIDGHAAITTGGIADLEEAFAYLGWKDPHLTPHLECGVEGCYARMVCGAPTKDGYKFLCRDHYSMFMHYTGVVMA